MKHCGAIPLLLFTSVALAQPVDPQGSVTPAEEPSPPAPAPPAAPVVAPPVHQAPVPPRDLPSPGRASDPDAIADYHDGLMIRTRDDAFRLAIGGWVIARWELRNTASNIDEHFALPSTRLIVSGHAFSTIDYALGAEVSSGSFELRDAYLDQPLPVGKLQIGQFKPFFSHQQLMSRALVTFTERAPTFDFAGISRDIGAALHHEPRARRGGVEVAVGVFNGAGITPHASCMPTTDPDPLVVCNPPTTAVASGRPLATARVALRSARVAAERDDDLAHSQPSAAIGVGYAVDLAGAESAEMTHIVTADLLVKNQGLSFAAAAFVKSVRGADGRTTQLAWHAQLAYVPVPHLLEIAARFSQVPVLEGADHAYEAVTAVNVYRRGHRLKWQVEAGVMRVSGESDTDWVTRAQTQLIF